MKHSLGRIVRKSNVQQRTTINAFKDKGKTNAKPQAQAQTQGNFHRGFKEMIEWRREREKKERLIRNKVHFQYKSQFSLIPNLEINGYIEE